MIPNNEGPFVFTFALSRRRLESRWTDPAEPTGLVARLRKITPGIVAGAADLDPAAVLTATVAGRSFGYSIGWVVLVAIPVLWAVFSVAASIGHHSNRGLVELIRMTYGRSAGWGIAAAMISVNMTMIIADLIAVSATHSRSSCSSTVFSSCLLSPSPCGICWWSATTASPAAR